VAKASSERLAKERAEREAKEAKEAEEARKKKARVPAQPAPNSLRPHCLRLHVMHPASCARPALRRPTAAVHPTAAARYGAPPFLQACGALLQRLQQRRSSRRATAAAPNVC